MIGELDTLETGKWRLRFTRDLAHPIERAWQALTEPEQLQAWFPQRIVGDLLTPGAPLRFEHTGVDMPAFEGRVLAVEPPSLLEFLWGTDTLRFELAKAEGGCTLTLMDTIGELGRAARDGAGWHACLDVLEAALDGRAATLTAGDRWQEVHKEYIDAFGPEAATIGPPEELRS
jgi:uncharacterized protein YndB with AHSA1/START domain